MAVKYPCCVLASWLMPPAQWISEDDLKQPPRVIPVPRIIVHCGPSAPKPDPPTADTFAEGVFTWLFH